jgi:phage tail-like protein
MSFSNLNYLWEHLPALYRLSAQDDGYFLKRLLSAFGAEMDEVDAGYDSFHLKLAPSTAPEEFVEFWLWALFGWAWFPTWFTVAQRRHFYSNVGRHYARRGTKRGIEEFLRDFGVAARVINQPQFWGEFTVGEDEWMITGPLGVVVQIFPQAAAVPEDQTFYDEFTVGEDHAATPMLSIGKVDVDGLLRFQQPVGQIFMIEEKVELGEERGCRDKS